MNYKFKKKIISEHVASRGFSKVLTANSDYLLHWISINLINIHIQVHKEPKLWLFSMKNFIWTLL